MDKLYTALLVLVTKLTCHTVDGVRAPFPAGVLQLTAASTSETMPATPYTSSMVVSAAGSGFLPQQPSAIAMSTAPILLMSRPTCQYGNARYAIGVVHRVPAAEQCTGAMRMYFWCDSSSSYNYCCGLKCGRHSLMKPGSEGLCTYPSPLPEGWKWANGHCMRQIRQGSQYLHHGQSCELQCREGYTLQQSTILSDDEYHQDLTNSVLLRCQEGQLMLNNSEHKCVPIGSTHVDVTDFGNFKIGRIIARRQLEDNW